MRKVSLRISLDGVAIGELDKTTEQGLFRIILSFHFCAARRKKKNKDVRTR
jgi:hypothetical protein